MSVAVAVAVAVATGVSQTLKFAGKWQICTANSEIMTYHFYGIVNEWEHNRSISSFTNCRLCHRRSQDYLRVLTTNTTQDLQKRN